MDNKYDAFVVGAGPNGLAAAIVLQRSGLSVKLIEAKNTIGGGARTAELTLSGFQHDVCAAIHPLGYHSPIFNTMPLKDHGLEWIYPDIALAHTFEKGKAVALWRDLMRTVTEMGESGKDYRRIIEPLTEDWDKLMNMFLDPLQWPKDPVILGKFGLKALRSATSSAAAFNDDQIRGLWAGMAGHAMLPLSKMTTAAIAFVLTTSAHTSGWPIVKGGSQKLSDALGSYFKSIGGEIETGRTIQNIDELPEDKLVMMDVTPRQLYHIAGHKFHFIYNAQLKRYKYSMGVYKMDWALSEPVPFVNEWCRKAGTLHLGGSFESIERSEEKTWNGEVASMPLILLAQQSLFDHTRAPEGKHTLWGYCHVPHGSIADMTDIIEDQIERYAPGFNDVILERHVMNARSMEDYNANYIGGDINGGAQTLGQLFTRPAIRISPYSTPDKNIWICSSSTPPGGGVHGMGGYNAAKRALRDIYGIRTDLEELSAG